MSSRRDAMLDVRAFEHWGALSAVADISEMSFSSLALLQGCRRKTSVSDNLRNLCKICGSVFVVLSVAL